MYVRFKKMNKLRHEYINLETAWDGMAIEKFRAFVLRISFKLDI